MSRLSEAGPFSGARALVVEDEFLIAVEIQEILEGAGAREVVLTARLSEALSHVSTGTFDFAVIDRHLGRQSTDELAVRLHELVIPFVFVTGAGKDDQSNLLSGVPVVRKPYTASALIAAISESVAKAQK